MLANTQIVSSLSGLPEVKIGQQQVVTVTPITADRPLLVAPLDSPNSVVMISGYKVTVTTK